MDPVQITALVLVLAIVGFVSNRIPAPIVALGVALALYFTGTITFEQTIAGFGDPIVIYLAGLFVVSESLDATGVTAWVGQQLTRRVGDKRTSVLVAMMVLSAVVTALISVNGAVASLVPVAVMLAARTGEPPSQMLIPLAFAAHAGSMLTMLGTPINVLISELSEDAGYRSFGFFEFGLVGVPLVLGVMALTLLLGPRLLPHRYPDNAPSDLSGYAETLAADYMLGPEESGISYETGAVEIVIPPRSRFLGDHVYPGMRTESGELIVVAVLRGGEHVERADLQVGDVVVLRGAWDALDRQVASSEILSVEGPEQIRRQSVHLGPPSFVAVGVLAATVVLLALNVVPPAIIVMAAAGVLVVTGVLRLEAALRSISLTTLIVVAGMIPLSTAIQTSGAADLISEKLVSWFGGGSPTLLLLGIVVVVLILGQFISNLATVLIVAPIAMTVAETTGVSPLPMLMGMTIAGAASFLTPVATASNLMVQDPGAYRFGDYWKLGLPCLLLFGTVATLLVPIIWPF